MRTSQDYETGNWHGKWCAASLKSFVRINKYLKNENTVICQESFQSSLPMCTQTQNVLKTFEWIYFCFSFSCFSDRLNFRYIRAQQSESLVTFYQVLEPALQNIRARPGEDVPDQHPLGDALEPADQPEQLNTLFLPGATANWHHCTLGQNERQVVLVGAESFCLHVGGGGDGGLHPRAGGLLGLLSPLHQICQGQHWVGRYLKNNDNTAKMVLRWFYACNCLSVNQLENCQSYSLHSENLSSNKKNVPGWLPLSISLSTSTFHFHFSLPLSIFHFPLLLSTFHFHFPGWLPTGVFCWSRLYHHHNRQARFNLWS